MKYLYEGSTVIGFIRIENNEEKLYYYSRNLLGEITKIYDSNNVLVGEYKYDAYGKVISYTDTSNILSLNPFRYKGYYYDVETGLFWLSSRYFSPELCRFISLDDVEYLDPESINGLNLYSYCYNNMNMYEDYGGYFPSLALRIIYRIFPL